MHGPMRPTMVGTHRGCWVRDRASPTVPQRSTMWWAACALAMSMEVQSRTIGMGVMRRSEWISGGWIHCRRGDTSSGQREDDRSSDGG